METKITELTDKLYNTETTLTNLTNRLNTTTEELTDHKETLMQHIVHTERIEQDLNTAATISWAREDRTAKAKRLLKTMRSQPISTHLDTFKTHLQQIIEQNFQMLEKTSINNKQEFAKLKNNPITQLELEAVTAQTEIMITKSKAQNDIKLSVTEHLHTTPISATINGIISKIVTDTIHSPATTQLINSKISELLITSETLSEHIQNQISIQFPTTSAKPPTPNPTNHRVSKALNVLKKKYVDTNKNIPLKNQYLTIQEFTAIYQDLQAAMHCESLPIVPIEELHLTR
eukprot:jgi/Psemu1/24921/gm1.24921_g